MITLTNMFKRHLLKPASNSLFGFSTSTCSTALLSSFYPVSATHEYVYQHVSSIKRYFSTQKDQKAPLWSFSDVASLSSSSSSSSSLPSSSIALRGRVHNVKAMGKKMLFLTLRGSPSFTMQAVLFKGKAGEAAAEEDKLSQTMPFAELRALLLSLSPETMVEVTGTLQPSSVRGCTISHVELQLEKVDVLSSVFMKTPPFQLQELMLLESQDPENKSVPSIQPSTRQHWRWLDLRSFRNQHLFSMRSHMLQAIRRSLEEQMFMEIHTPKLVGDASENGSEVFSVSYFPTQDSISNYTQEPEQNHHEESGYMDDQEASSSSSLSSSSGLTGKAYLAQSPQLFKQMLINSDFPRVYEVGPLFRFICIFFIFV